MYQIVLSITLSFGLAVACHALELEPQHTTRTSQKAEPQRIVALLERCQSLGPWISDKSPKGQNAVKLYQQHCVPIVEKMAENEGLDVFFLPHARYLTQTANHQRAHHFYTLAYQCHPDDALIIDLLAQSFVTIGSPETALELLQFYQDNFPEAMNQALTAKLDTVTAMVEEKNL